MKKIPLTQGHFAIVDDADYEWLNQWKWRAKKAAYLSYAARSVRVNGKTETVYMHRLIMDCPKGKEVDHANRVTFDNRRDNLRICERSENQKNRFYKSKKGSAAKC